MSRRRSWIAAAAVIVFLAILAAVIRNQIRVYQGREARGAAASWRRQLFEALQPVALANCELTRFGERNDGGYLMCGNLLGAVRSGYSYGISGYDQWGCDVSTRLGVPVHQYDCFNTTRPACPGGQTIFHPECVGAATATVDGRLFDTIAGQFEKNLDRSKPIVFKIDVEGAEWDSLLAAPDEILQQIDQMTVEFHWAKDQTGWASDDRYIRLAQRLKQFFEVAHLHFNNASCVEGLEPFTSWAYEVLFVSKRLAVVDRSRPAGGLHPLDAPNNPSFVDCQPRAR